MRGHRLLADVLLIAAGQAYQELTASGASPAPRSRAEAAERLATGASAKQVAYARRIAPKTASTHIERIYAKCGVSSRSGTTRFAIAHGLVTPLEPTGR